MRVIAGSARHLKLKTRSGEETRPTQDIVKETLFNIIQMRVPGSSFLDLFAGSGSIGIEALSRDADRAVFVDNSRDAVKVIWENLEFTHLTDRAQVITSDWRSALYSLENKGRFDMIYVDPPYKSGLEKKVLDVLRESKTADSDTLIIIEASRETDFSYVQEMGYEVFKDKLYRNNRHLFLRKTR
ncbi:MAG: 16S rRNA (guanine(966)-N(2))-methyltransferase RsmD [Lachnospiraceae bacterium]|nr:16S rRNA (guanine(966)-N(2))-methyltransferase RsmD [Lachnospiraceae bacterium]